MFANLDWFSRGLLSHDGRADRDVHAALRDLANHRLVGARHRAAQRRQDHPAVGELRRARRPEVRPDRRSEPKPIRHRENHVRRRSATSARSPTASSSTSPTTSTKYKITSKEAFDTARHCLIDTLGCGFEALSYPACTKLLGPIVPGTVVPHGAKVPGTPFQLDPGAGRVQHRRDDPLARLQRHLARRGMGPSVGQPRRHPRHRRLAVAHRGRRGQAAAHDEGRAGRDDQGARDPGRDRAREQLQPRRPRSRRAGQGRVHRGRREHARPLARRSDQRRVARVGRRPEPAHLPPRAQHGLAQELGGGRRDRARGAPRADREDRRDGLPVGAHREDLGLLRRAVQGQRVQVPAARTAAT